MRLLARLSQWTLVTLLFAMVASAQRPAVTPPNTLMNVGPDLGTYSVGEVNIPLVASGGTGAYTWTVTPGSLPPGLSIRTDVPSWFQNAQAGIIGLATTPGTYNFTLSVTGGGDPVTAPVSVRITALNAKDPYNLPDGFLLHDYTYQFTATGTATVTWTADAPMPPGLNLSASGVLSGVPNQSGGYNVSVALTDGADTVHRTFRINVYALQFAGSATLPDAVQNAPYTYTLNPSGGTPPYRFMPNGMPNGLTLNSSTGVISGTDTNSPGRYSFNVWVGDSANPQNSYSRNFEVNTVASAQPLMQINLFSSDDCNIGSCVRTFGVFSGGIGPFTWTVTGLPAGMSYRRGTIPWSAPSDLEIFGAPTTAVTTTIAVTVTDSTGATVTQNFPLHFSPLIVDGQDYLPNGTVGSAYARNLRVVGGSGGYTAQIVAGALPAGVGLYGMNVSGAPQENGNFNVTFLFSDSAGATLRQSMGFFVNSNTTTTSPITINNFYDLGSFRMSQPLNVQLFACCVGGLNWSVIGGSLPNGVTLSATGQVVGTPTVDGTFTFLVQAADSSNPSNVGIKQLTMGVSPLWITTMSLPFGNVSTPYNQTLANTGVATPLNFSLAYLNLLPPGLTLDATTGAITGTPTSPGQFNFTVILTDRVSHRTTRSFGLTIYPAGGAPPVSITTPAEIGTWSIGVHEFGLNANGGDNTFTWTLAGGALPPGMSLRPDFPAWFTASANFSGVATTPGDYTFTLTASSSGQTGSRTFHVKVVALRLKDGYNIPDGFINVAYPNYTLTALGNAGPVTFTATGLPNGMSLAPDGTISGTPTQSGFFSVVVTLNDGVDIVTASFNLNLNVYIVRLLGPATFPAATQYLPYSYTLTGGGGGVPPYRFTSNSLPNGLTLSTDGTITGTTTTGPGRWGFNLTVSDSNGIGYTRSVVIPVIGSPAPTVLALVPYLDDCTVGAPCSRSIAAQNGGRPPFTWQATGLPEGVSIRNAAGDTQYGFFPGAGELWGTPSAAGNYTIVVTMTDADGHVSIQAFPFAVSQLFVQGVDYLPSGTRNAAYSRTLRVIGGTGPYSVTPIVTYLPAGLLLTGMTLAGTPTENGSFSAYLQYADTLGHTLKISEGFNISNIAGATLNINNSWDLGSIPSGVSSSITLFACCAPSFTWSKVSGNLPPGINLSLSGTLSGTPTATGIYKFLVQVADQTNLPNTAVKQFTLAVTNLAISTSTLPYGNAGTLYTQAISTTGATGAVTFALSSGGILPTGVVLLNGVITGTPSGIGIYNFTITATDSTNITVWKPYTLTVYPAGATPPLSLSFGPTIGPNSLGVQTFQLSASGGTPPYHYSYSPSATPIPGMRVLDGPPLPTNFPSNITGGLAGLVTAAGTYTTSIRVTDATTSTYDRPVTWTVIAIAPLNPNTLPNATNGVAYSFTMSGYGGSGNYSWSATSLPAGLTMSAAGMISGTPTTTGSVNPNITIKDLTSNFSFSFGYTLAVNAFAITSPATLPQGTVGTAYSTTFTAPSCNNCTWSISNGSLPSGLSLNSSTGVLSGTPQAYYNTSFRVRASGAAGVVDKQVSLVIQSLVPVALEITMPANLGNTVVNTTATVSLLAQGGTPPYTWTLDSGTLPTGMALAAPGETIGSNLFPGYTYLAGRAMQAGTFSFTLRVTDSASTSVTRAFTWPIAILSNNYTNLPLSGAPLTYNVAYNQPLLVFGGTGSYTNFAIVSGALPPGLSINPTTGVVSGTPLNTGSYSPSLQITDSAGATVFQNLNLTVGNGMASSLNPGNSDSMIIQLGGTTYSQLNPSGGTGPYTYTPVGAYPAGCTIQVGSLLNGVSGTYQLACSPFAAGDYTLTLRMEDSATPHNFAVRTIAIHVLPITLLSSTSLPAASVGVAYSAALLTTGNLTGINASLAPGSAYPPGLSLGSGVIAGTPTAPGNYSFTLIVTDPSGFTNPFTFSLPVSPIAITNPDIIPVSAIVNVPFSYQLTASGGGSSKTWSLDTGSSLPGGFTLNSAGLLSGTASSMGNGIFKLNAKVSDGTNSITHPLTLFVRYASPYVLSIDPTLQDVRVGANLNLALNVAGGTPPYTWTVPAGSILPPGLALQGGPTLSFYSSAQTVGNTYLTGAPTTPGTFAFDLIATDAAGVQARCTFTLNVLALSILGGSLRSGTVGVGYSQQLTAVGGAPPYNFTYEPSVLGRDMLPAGLTASSSGLISGTPTSTGDFNLYAVAHDSAGRAFRSAYSFSVSTSQGLRITSQPGPTWAVGIGPQLFLNIAGSSTYTWTVSSGSLPPGVTIGTTGSSPVLVGTPTMAGPYNFTLRATDTANGANVAERAYSIVVAPMLLNTHRATTLPPARTGTGYSYTFQPAGGTPPYTFSPVALAPLPPGLTVSAAGVLSGVPTTVGSYTPYVQIADSLGKTGLFPVRQLNVLGPGAVNPPQGRRFGFESASLNVPYGILIDEAVLGGTAPFTWTVADGSTLPPGLALKSAGGSTFLTGIPTATGSFTFTLNIVDAMGQTATTIATLVVSPLSIAEPNLPNGIVGSPYTASFTPSGGTAPYTFSLAYWGPAPPGLTFGANGAFAGVPSQPGFYNMGIVVTDHTGQTVTFPRWVTIDNASSQAQGIGIAQGRILMSYVRTAPAPPPVAIDLTATTGLLPWKAMVAGIPGATLSATTGAGTSLVNLTLNTVGLTAGTYTGAIGVTSAQSANGWENLQVTLTVVEPPPCIYTLNPTAGSVGAAGGSNSFSVSAGSLCSWTATASDPSWIAVTGSGTGAGTVGYTAAANTGITSRTGTITIAGQSSSATYSITQFGSACSYAISPAIVAATSTGGDAIINVTASNAACAWPAAQALTSGLVIAPLTGTGNGTVTVSIPANGTSAPVTRQAKIAGLDFTVNQTGINCTVGLDSSGASLGAGGGNGVVNVTTQATCSYSTVAGPNWISITSGATGAGPTATPLTFSVAPNSSTTPRSGTLTIGGQPFTISQDATPCSVTVDASALPGQFAMLGQFSTIGVNANGANCSWTASSPVTWATVSPMSGRGNGTITVTALSNAGAPSTLRNTTLTVAGQSLGIGQAGTSCTYSLGSSTATLPYGGGNGSVGVTAPAVCTWSSAPDVSAPWLHITSSGNAGSTDVQFTADPYDSSTPRTGTLTVAGRQFTVTQAGKPCNYVLVPTSTTLVSGGASSSFTFSTGTTGCSATALSYSNWLTVSTNTDIGGQSGTVNFTAAANSVGVQRAGTIQFGGQTFTVNQLAAQCAYSFTSYGAVYNKNAHPGGSVVASQSAIGCTPVPTIDLPSIANLTSLSGPVNNIWTQSFDVNEFKSMVTAIRRAVITFNGTTFVIKQTSW